jgi:release factor glutamine methyltransferase
VYTTLAPELHHEPESALRAGPGGSELIETLLIQARDVLTPDGLLIAEHAWDQGKSLREIAKAHCPTAKIATKRDLAGLERVLLVFR